MKKASLIFAVWFMVMGLSSSVFAADVKMVLATGGTAGTYYPFGGAMAKIWNSKIPGMNVTAQATGASVENVRLVNRGRRNWPSSRAIRSISPSTPRRPSRRS